MALREFDADDITRYDGSPDFYKALDSQEIQTLRTPDGGKIQRLIEADGTSDVAWYVDKDNRVKRIDPYSTPDKIIPLQGHTLHEMTRGERSFLQERGTQARIHRVPTEAEIAIRQGMDRQSFQVSATAKVADKEHFFSEPERTKEHRPEHGHER